MCFLEFYNALLFVHAAYIFPNIDICLYSGHFIYNIATIMLFLKKDKEFVARPITGMFLILLADAYEASFLLPNALLGSFVQAKYCPCNNFSMKRPANNPLSTRT